MYFDVPSQNSVSRMSYYTSNINKNIHHCESVDVLSDKSSP